MDQVFEEPKPEPKIKTQDDINQMFKLFLISECRDIEAFGKLLDSFDYKVEDGKIKMEKRIDQADCNNYFVFEEYVKLVSENVLNK